jgi:transposase
MLSISIESVKRWWHNFQQTGKIKPKTPIITKPREVNYEEVKNYIEANPDKALKEVGDKFNIHLTVSFYIFKKLGITYKKRDFYMKNEMKNK